MRGPLCSHAGWKEGCCGGPQRGRGGLLARRGPGQPKGGVMSSPEPRGRGSSDVSRMHCRTDVEASGVLFGDWAGVSSNRGAQADRRQVPALPRPSS